MKHRPMLLVTGVASGLGPIIAAKLAEHGKDIVLCNDPHIGYSETYGKPIQSFLGEWTKGIRYYPMYRPYKHQRRPRHEKREKFVPDFLRRLRGEHVLPGLFHYEDGYYTTRSGVLIRG